MISRYLPSMNMPPADPPKRRYRWPWIVGAALILWVLLAVVWMRIAVRQVEAQRDFSAPPATGSTR
jgi:hypothetical protein